MDIVVAGVIRHDHHDVRLGGSPSIGDATHDSEIHATSKDADEET
jgi:hypothetical protein